MRRKSLGLVGLVLIGLLGCSMPDNTGGGSNSLGHATVTLYLNAITAETTTGDDGVFMWVETQGGTFVKTLSYYIDWGASSTDGSSGLGNNKAWYVGNSSSGTTIGYHLAGSASWRTASGVTSNKYAPPTNSTSVDAFTSATIQAAFSPIVFDGATTNAKMKSHGTPEEYFSLNIPGKLQGWDGTDQNGTAVAAGNYKIRLTVTRKANVASPASPYYTEYVAPVTVTAGGSATNTQFTLYNSTSDVSGGGGPVLNLSTSKVTFTPQ